MNNTSWGFAGVLLVIQLGFCGISEAATVTWSVKTSGGNVVCSGSGIGTANLPAVCGANLQFQASGGTARIEAIDTGTNDTLQLVNTKIVAQSDLTDYVLTFDHTFVPGPKFADYHPIYYRTQMYGTNISGNAPANKITVTSTVEHPVGTPLLNAAPTPAPPPLINFSYYVSPSTSTAMDQNRKIIVKVKFSLENTGYINFGSGRFVKVSAQAYPDPPDGVGNIPRQGAENTSPTSEVQRQRMMEKKMMEK